MPLGSRAIFAPLFVKDVSLAIKKIIENKNFHGKSFELFGPKSYSWNELMKYFQKTIKSKIYLVPIPIFLLSIPAFFFSYLPNPLITVDQLRRFKVKISHNSENLVLDDLNIKPSTLEIEMQKYLKNF